MTPNPFNTITGSDWRVSLIAARSRRTLNEIKIRNQITNKMSKQMPKMKELIPHADEPKDRPEDMTDELIRLRTENARLQMELDASCNAEELRQVRAENARLKSNEDSNILDWLIYHSRARTFRTGLIAGILACCDYDPRLIISEMRARNSALPNVQAQR